MLTPAPQNETELLTNAQQLAGLTLAEVALRFNIELPNDLTRHKGWVGQLLECALGATAKSKAEPDFEIIHVELKTIPLDSNLQPKESTFVCTATSPFAATWHTSLVWKKLRRVLWLPIEAAAKIPLADRRIGQAILWSPTATQEKILQQDWEELTEMLTLGEYEQLTAEYGVYLQCRPKAAHSRILRHDINTDGESRLIVPQGFYLRTRFTQQVLLNHPV